MAHESCIPLSFQSYRNLQTENKHAFILLQSKYLRRNLGRRLKNFIPTERKISSQELNLDTFILKCQCSNLWAILQNYEWYNLLKLLLIIQFYYAFKRFNIWAIFITWKIYFVVVVLFPLIKLPREILE